MFKFPVPYQQPLRQGDVMLTPLANADLAHCQPVKAIGGRYVLQQGTANGNCHAVKSRNAKLFQAPATDGLAADRFLVLSKTSVLTHEEHSAIPLDAGTYLVEIQNEYTPAALVNVAD